MRLGYKKQHLNYGGKEYAFKNLIKCGCCGIHLVSYDITRKNKGDGRERHYTYLRCSASANKKKGYSCNSQQLREEYALAQVMDELKRIKIPEAMLKASLEQISSQSKLAREVEQTSRVVIMRRLSEIETGKSVWVEKEACGILPKRSRQC